MALIEREALIAWAREFWGWGDTAQFISAVRNAPTIDPIHEAGGCYCRECKFVEDCERQTTIVRRDYVLEQNIYEYRKVDWCSAGEPKEAQYDE